MKNEISVIISGVRGRMGKALVDSLRENPDLTFAGALEYPEHPDVGKPVFTVAESESGQANPMIFSNIKKATESLTNPVIIEFTTPKATLSHLEECAALGVPIVIGTTGFKPQEIKQIEKCAEKIPVVMAPNFSIGVNLMTKLVADLAARLPDDYDLEIVEAHHRHKKDAPSGTALRLARAVAEGRGDYLGDVICMHREGETGARPARQVGVQTIRGGDIVGDHTVMFAGPGERLEVIHRAHSRNNFASGAIRASRWLWQRDDQVVDLIEPALYDMFDVLGIK